MSETQPGFNESKEIKEYSIDEMLNLVFWSFQASQGSPRVHYAAWKAVLTQNPALVASAKKLSNELGLLVLDNPNPLIAQLAQRLEKFRGSEKHSRPMKTKMAHEEALKGISTFVTAAKTVESTSSLTSDYALETFIEATIQRDHDVEQRAYAVDGILLYRKRIGYSMLCWLGLSKKREERLTGKNKVDVPLPPEFQDLWRRSGDYVRQRFSALSSKARGYILYYAKRYEQELGENLGLPTA